MEARVSHQTHFRPPGCECQGFTPVPFPSAGVTDELHHSQLLHGHSEHQLSFSCSHSKRSACRPLPRPFLVFPFVFALPGGPPSRCAPLGYPYSPGCRLGWGLSTRLLSIASSLARTSQEHSPGLGVQSLASLASALLSVHTFPTPELALFCCCFSVQRVNPRPTTWLQPLSVFYFYCELFRLVSRSSRVNLFD